MSANTVYSFLEYRFEARTSTFAGEASTRVMIELVVPNDLDLRLPVVDVGFRWANVRMTERYGRCIEALGTRSLARKTAEDMIATMDLTAIFEKAARLAKHSLAYKIERGYNYEVKEASEWVDLFTVLAAGGERAETAGRLLADGVDIADALEWSEALAA